MKFVKSKFAQKLIIVLIALMILNIAIPHEVKAWDLGGILLKPLFSLILSGLVSIDVTIGVVLNGLSIAVNGIGSLIEAIDTDKEEGLNDINDALNQLFIGPDSIFAGKVRILDANIFEVEDYDSTTDFLDTIKESGIVEDVDSLSDVTSPGYHLIVSLKEGIATTYRIIRNICGYIMLAGLIFTGIRILISSNIPSQKTKYLMLLQDWIIGMILLIFSHVIMVGVFSISDLLVDALSSNLYGVGGLNFNLIMQCLASFDSGEQIICLIMLGYLIYLTIAFTISYFTRLMWICVLIIIAPIVSVMYSFGSSTKGIYSKWIKEYIMTVLVQPFHLIVYYVLVSIPLNIINSDGGWSLTAGNIIQIIYCLVAISFIRPSEKYIRELFNMDKGIGNMASYDTGKKVVDSVVKMVTTVAAIAPTAGIGTASMGELIGKNAEKALINSDKEVLSFRSKKPNGIMDSADETKTEGIFNKDKRSEGIDIGSLPNEEGQQGDRNSRESIPVIGARELAQIGEGKRHITNESDDITEVVDRKNETSNKSLDTSEKPIEATERLNEAAENLNEAANNLEKATNQQLDISENTTRVTDNNDAYIEIESIGEDNYDSTRKKNKGLYNWASNKLDNASTFTKVTTGSKEIFEALSDIDPNTKLGKQTGKFMNSDLGQSIMNFEKLGGMKELHKGFNEIRNAMSPVQIDDWKPTNERLEHNINKRQENNKFQFINNKNNKEFFQIKYEKELREQYKNKEKYSDAYIKNLAKEKTESKLKSLADTYVPLGIKDAKVASECEEDRKKYGLSAERAVRNRAEFEKFNINVENVQKVNAAYKTDASSVIEKIPNSREYYNNGYKDAGHQIAVNELASRLAVSPEFAMKLDQVLMRKGGKIKENTGNPNVDKVIKEINDNYRKNVLKKQVREDK